MISCDAPLRPDGDHDLAARVTLSAGDRVRLWLAYHRPEEIAERRPAAPAPDDLDRWLDETQADWEG